MYSEHRPHPYMHVIITAVTTLNLMYALILCMPAVHGDVSTAAVPHVLRGVLHGRVQH